MLIILTLFLVIAAVILLFVKKNRRTFYLLGLCLSLMLQIVGVMIYVAKKGGISQELLHFLYFSREIQTRIQYFLITLNQLGFLIALGRTLFPFFLIRLAMSYSMIPMVRQNPQLRNLTCICPIVTLICYTPFFYHEIVGNQVWAIRLIQNLTLSWSVIYLAASAFLVIYEYVSISMKFCKWQFTQISLCMAAMTGIYLLYFRQDPGQVYNFYLFAQYYSDLGLEYLSIKSSLGGYLFLVVVSTLCCILGFYSFGRYTNEEFMEGKENLVMERKFDAAKVGASMFVHSMKNQLLSSRVIYKRIDQLYEQEVPDQEKLRSYIKALEDCNNTMLERMEELYRSVKSNRISMVPVDMEQIAENALRRFHSKFPEIPVKVDTGEVTRILADEVHLCEALYNLLVNAQEAIVEANRGEQGEISLICHNERLYSVIEVCDNGSGMTKAQIKRVFDPFYSSKNSNSNWGMGLYYVREIIRSHLGTLRIESKKNVGSSFYILLPKYQ